MDDEASAEEPGSVSAVRGLLARGIEACRTRDRSDLERGLRAADARLAAPAAMVAVVGEYKAGKSSLINALVGRDVCPVDDYLATTVLTAVHHGAEPSARLRRLRAGELGRELVPIELADLPGHVMESEGYEDRSGVEAVEVALPSALLARGLTLLDTPGVGGLLEEHVETTLRFLAMAHGVLFVTDAAAELSGPELQFLDQARDRCSTVVVAVTKCDLHPAWKRIVELDRGHLLAAGVDLPVLAVSADLDRAARSASSLGPKADGLRRASGLPALEEALVERVVTGARDEADRRARIELAESAAQLGVEVRAEIRAVEDPEAGLGRQAAFQEARTRLAALQEAGSRWTNVLHDGITDLRTEVDLRLRTGLDAARDEAETRLSEVDPSTSWEELQRRLRTRIGDEVDGVLTLLEERSAELQAALASTFHDLDLGDPDLPQPSDLVAVDVPPAERGVTGGRGGVELALAAARGGSSGVVLLRVLGSLAGIAVATPVALGVGAAFGAKQVLDLRKQAVERRRQEGRVLVRQLVEHIRPELTVAVRQAVKELHRTLRDHYSAQVRELQRTYDGAVRSLATAVSKDRAEAEARLPVLRAELAEVEAIRMAAVSDDKGPTGRVAS